MHTVPVLLLLAGAVILAGVVAVAMGHGGEMAEFPSDYVPPTLGDLLTAADVAMLRPPSAVWGYNTQVTDEALSRIAQIVTERDVEIAVLRQQLADLRSGTGAPPASAGPASGSPASAGPASVSPASVSPASVSPASVSPASVSPASVSRAGVEPAAADEPAAAAADTDAAARDETPPAPVLPADEAAAPGDD